MDAAPPTRRPPLLLVEPDVDAALRFSQAVRAAGDRWDLFSVPDLPAARRCLNAALADANCRPAAVFINLALGAEDALDLMAWIRGKSDLGSCILVAVATPDNPALAHAAAHGTDAFLTHPVDPGALASILHRHL